MLTISCAEVCRNLSAYHDEELPVRARIAIADHLETCAGCAVEADDLVAIREALRADCSSERGAWGPELSRAQSDIVERMAAEEQISLTTWIGELLEDRRRALATVGASITACVLVVVAMGQLGLGTVDHPDSFARLLEQAGRVRAEREEMPVVWPRVNAESIMPAAVMNGTEGDESVSAFAALIKSDGELAELELLEDQPIKSANRASQKQQVLDLLAAASTASFQPARQAAGKPVPLNVIWVVTHRTVRATAHAVSTFRTPKTV